MAAAISSTVETLVPAFSARSDPRWITGPSAIGSENGTPSSIRSAPPRSSAATSSGVRSGEGSPAVMYVIKAGRRSVVRSLSKSRPILVWLIELLKILAINVRVFVAAPGEIDDEQLIFTSRSTAHGFGDRMRGFERGNNSFQMRQRSGGFERVLIGGRDVLGAALIAQPRMFRPHQRVIQAR